MVEAIVEYDYKAQHDDELTITVGDIISNIRKDEGGWWEGEVDGRRGLFPDNFVREIRKEVKKDPAQTAQATQTGGSKTDLSNGSASPGSESSLRPAKKGEAIRKRRCRAAFSYIPQNEDELELKIGDIIEILSEVEEGWWEGSLNGKRGVFPSNFTKELLGDPGDSLTPQDEVRSTRTSVKDSTGSESDGGDSSSTRSDAGSVTSGGEIQPKKVRGFGFGDIFKDCPIKLRPRSMDIDSEMEKQQQQQQQQAVKKPPVLSAAPETMKAEPDSKVKAKEYCKVIFPYEAQNEDELSIKEGEIVAIISKECADAGWWLGELNGRQGVFPDNFVKLLVPDVEKERPKKPPPPAAPTAKQNAEKKPDAKKVPPERPESLPQRGEEKAGEEVKAADIPKPALPAVPPKKPLPPKTTNSLGRPSSFTPKRPERPERPAGPTVPCEAPKWEGGGSALEKGSSDRPHDIDVEDFDSIVSSTEKLNHPTASRPRVTDRRPRSQVFTSSSLSSPDLLDSPSPEEEKRERGKEELDSLPPKAGDGNKKAPEKSPLPPKPVVPPSSSSASAPSTLSSLLPTPLAAALRPPSPSAPDSKPKSDPGPQGPLTMEELRAQLRDLRGSIELMKNQHKKEIKQLMNELDEEKRIRLSLQMEVEHIKKVLSK
ncbi:SH3 domain-containing kinase-binding protein 1 isoform X2 [Megalops cyprinoides]|uniref:SH3 domain-containing kinase-binding protein 1 isoform X2 n=1 Tax=Megalops cyprinoides TaxID=118141 RepID=UPI001865301F|nr:SH3 domain-containing kinase-binding protein 1 isoform X2 [Megalops cyprinoides]